jgi:hypothetical protein
MHTDALMLQIGNSELLHPFKVEPSLLWIAEAVKPLTPSKEQLLSLDCRQTGHSELERGLCFWATVFVSSPSGRFTGAGRQRERLHGWE